MPPPLQRERAVLVSPGFGHRHWPPTRLRHLIESLRRENVIFRLVMDWDLASPATRRVSAGGSLL